MLSACLITEEPSFQEPENRPPSLESVPDPTPLNRVVILEDPGSGGGGGDAGMPITTLTFRARVRDPDPNDTLVGYVWVNWQPNAGVKRIEDLDFTVRGPFPPDGQPVSFLLPVSTLAPAPSCNRVELRMSRAFQPEGGISDLPREPDEPGDLGTATWWVFAVPRGEDVDVRTCPAVAPGSSEP